MKKRYSGDIGLEILFGVFYTVFLIFVAWLWEMEFNNLLNSCFIINILLWSSFVRFFTFHDEYYEVLFPLRIVARKKTIYYKDIHCVNYNVINGGRMGKQIKIAKYGHKTMFYSLKYIIACDLKDAKPLLLFFKSKGIKIKIISNGNRDEYANILNV